MIGRIIDRVLDRRSSVRRAVLLVDDQRRNALPTVCVKTGEPTDGAIRIRAVESRHADLWATAIGQAATVAVFRLLRRPVDVVSLPVSATTWRLWRSRLTVGVVVSTIGAALTLVGVLRGVAGMIAFGLVALGLGWLNRVRAWNNAWVGVELRSTNGEFVVSRVHSTFDVEAKAMYSRAIISRAKRPGL